MNSVKPSISLVLSSGGARGIAHIGVIEEILSRGYTINSVAGASMGALVGGVYAAAPIKGVDIFREWLADLDKRRMFELMDFSFSLDGLVKGKRVVKAINNFIPDIYIEDLRIPFAAVATNILNGDEVVFTRGKLFDAIRASISIPSLFKPYKIDKMLLVDGAVTNPLPLNCAIREEGDILVAVDVSAKSTNSLKKSDVNYYSLMIQTTNIMVQQLTTANVERYSPDILINIPYDCCRAMEFYKSEEIVKIGREQARIALNRYEERLKFIKE